MNGAANQKKTKGSGGQGRAARAGRGPTPKAKDRVGHPAQRRARAQARNRKKTHPEVILGRNGVLEALSEGIPATELLIAASLEDDPKAIKAKKLAVKHEIPVGPGTRAQLDTLADGLPHQGIALVVPPFRYTDLDTLIDRAPEVITDLGAGSNQPLLVVLDHLQDAGNLGAIARSCAAFASSGMVIADRRAASVTASAWRASAGALSRLPVAKVNNIARSLNRLKKADYLVLGLSTHSGTPINNLQGEFLDRPIALVVGSESTGMSRLVAESCDVLTNIEIARSTESLNASVATGIALNVIRSA